MLTKVKALLKEPLSREDFFEMIDSFIPPIDPRHKQIESAYDFGLETFEGEVRDTGDAYNTHLDGISIIQIQYLRIRDPDLIISGRIHDNTEHKPDLWPIERTNYEYGPRVALWQAYLTKPPKGVYPSEEKRLSVFYGRLPFAPREFWLVKLPDVLHNFLTLWACSPEKKIRKIEEAKKIYLPYAEKEIILINELEEAIEELEKPKPS